MGLQNITGPDDSDMTGFVIIDLDDATRADGVVRSAKKVLVDGARSLARSRTYAWALMGHQISGASAAVNVPPEGVDAGVAAFVDAVRDQVAAGTLSLDAAKGVRPSQLSALDEVDTRPALRLEERPHGTFADELLARGVLTAASTALGGLDGRTIAIEGAGSATAALIALAAEAGARITGVGSLRGALVDADGIDTTSLLAGLAEHGDGVAAAMGSELAPAALLDAPADVLFCGSKAGLVDHTVAATLPQQLIVPVGAVPVTAKGLAVAGSRDITVLPDFLTTSGPLHAWAPDAATDADGVIAAAEAFIAATTGECLAHDEGAVLGACYRAEDHLRTWQERLPFGRPLA